MAEDIGIVMTLYDKLSPTLKAIGNNTKAFDKDMQALEQACAAYEKTQDGLNKSIAELKSKLAASNVAVKESTAAWKKNKDEMNRRVMDKAIAEQNEYRQQLKDTEAALNSSRKAVVNYANEMRKTENATSAVGGTSLLNSLKTAGLTRLVGDSLAQAGGALVNSAMGQSGAMVAQNMLSGIGQGAAMGAMVGSIAGAPGWLVGAGIGAASGLVSGVTQVATQRDEAFKGYVQEGAEGQLTQRSGDIAAGSSIAAQREQDVIAFEQLLGKGRGRGYLEDLRKLAAETPLEYSDLTGMSRVLATGFGDDPDRMLGLMRDIGDAGSAVGIDASGMTEMARAMSRMESSNKATRENLDIIQDRGINVFSILGDAFGKTQGEIYTMVSKGQIQGVEAVKIIQSAMEEMYGGASAMQAKTFSGLSSTLADAEAEMQNAFGEGYNDVRGKGIKEQTDYLTGESGAVIQEANKAIGAWQASLENAKEEFIRAAQDEVINSEDYQKAMAQGTDEGYAEAGAMLMAAKVRGMSEYNASDGARLALESEKTLVETIRNDTAANRDYWDAGYERGNWYTKGVAAALAGARFAEAQGVTTITSTSPNAAQRSRSLAPGHAYGLDRVPYDDFPVRLHEGERVLTAAQARQNDRGGGVNVNLTGPVTIREEADLDKLARRLAQRLARAELLST